jgi:hypothetical protein
MSRTPPAAGAAFAIAFAAFHAHSAFAGVSFRVVAITGQPAPGTPLTFAAPFDPRFDENRTVSYWARLAGAGVTPANDGSIWSERTDPATLVSREGNTAPGTTTGVISGISSLSLTPDSRAVFAASIAEGAPTTPTNVGVFAEDAALSLGLAYREPPSTFRIQGPLSIADSGDAIWSESTLIRSSARGILADASTPVPGAGTDLPAGSVFRRFGAPAIDPASGAIAFRAAAGIQPATDTWSYGLWSDRSGPLDLVEVQGRQAGDRPPGETFAKLSNQPAISPDGAVFFWAGLQGGTLAPPLDNGVFVSRPGDPLRCIAFAGEPLFSHPDLTFAGFAQDMSASDDGRVSFLAHLAGAVTNATNSAILATDAADNALIVARAGDVVPGTTLDVRFGVLSAPRSGGAGNLAFSSTLSGADVTPATSRALFATNATGSLEQIVRTGTAFTVAPGDVRTIRSFSFDHAQAGRRQMMLDGGLPLLTFTLSFTNNTRAVVVATLVCPADFNSDGTVDFFDYLDFVQAFSEEDPRADLDHNGQVDFFDYLDFVTSFDSGC